MISMHVLGELLLHSWHVEGVAPEAEEGTQEGEGAPQEVTVCISPGIDS